MGADRLKKKNFYSWLCFDIVLLTDVQKLNSRDWLTKTWNKLKFVADDSVLLTLTRIYIPLPKHSLDLLKGIIPSNYLTRGTAERKKLVKLWISSHELIIELGRYNQSTRDNRNCTFCGSRCNQIEEVLLIRNNFYNKVKILIPNIIQLTVNVLINELMNTSNYY